LIQPRGDGAKALVDVLGGAGARIETVRTAQEVVDAFQAAPPTVVIADLDEAEARDYQLIRRIRSLKNGHDVPAIAVSALPWEEHRVNALAAGFSQWISEPAREAIVDVAANLLRRDAAHVPRALSEVSAGRSLLTDVATTPVSEIIRHLWRARRTGDLLVRSRRTIKMTFFERGQIVFAASNVRKERLGEVLMALGTISGDEFHLASKVMAKRKVRFGDALVAAGVMQKGAVATSVVQWVERIVLSLFDVSTGSASFEDRPCPIPPSSVWTSPPRASSIRGRAP
jgi:DNA-binding response OmpR family regulator